MQRFLRDPGHTLSADHFSRTCDERVAVLQTHFPPSVAAVYALPRLGQDGVLEWWTTQQGQVRPYSALSEPQQLALLQQYDQHQARLANLAEALASRGLARPGELVHRLRAKAEPANLYSVEGQLLVTRWVDIPPPAPESVPPPVPLAPAARRLRWWPIGLGLLLLIALLAGLLWFLAPWRTVSAPLPIAAPEPMPEQDPAAQQWPAELTFLLDTSQRMEERPFGSGGSRRSASARREIEKLVKSLPEKTEMRLVHSVGGQCTAPRQWGPYPAKQRTELLSQLGQAQSAGKASLAAGLRVAASGLNGKDRDALIFVFSSGADACGEDICAVARKIHKEQPRLKINLIDLSGKESADDCLVSLTGGNGYTLVDGNKGSVDLAVEVSKMLEK
ncbi:membrane protein [Bordetella ansorpii]|uniref:Membrane protein n=1 Tax=Bordetella ansorpii TaxID=288768 RepID=A0A157Q0D0_9BORD|nr:VWA domain-containing protein [Bordetella ansorpii]SAI39058.1 membrane protein [Bordetella ansorpii]